MRMIFTGLAVFGALAATCAGAQDARYVQYTFYAYAPFATFGSTQGPSYGPAQEVSVLTLDTMNLTGSVGDIFSPQAATYQISDSGITVDGRDSLEFEHSHFEINFAPGTFDFDPPYSIGLTSKDFLSSYYTGSRTLYHAEYNGSGYVSALYIAVSNTSFPGGVGYRFLGAGPVPETATWAMMISGFGLVGGAVRRARTSVAVTA